MLKHKFRNITAPGISIIRMTLAILLATTAAATVAAEHAFGPSPTDPRLLAAVQLALAYASLVVWGDLNPLRPNARRWASVFVRVAEPMIVVAAIAEIATTIAASELIASVLPIALLIRINSILARTLKNPSILFPTSFIVLISVSTLLLKLPAATPQDLPISWTDALFTATSAVCVTGLAVRDTATGFTDFGQIVILASIQLGGLGVMIFGSTLALLFGARLSHREHLTLSKALDEYPVHRIVRFTWFIVLTMLVLEAIGAIILYTTWPHDPSVTTNQRIWHSVFHSISAFCNAGFDITGQSMIPVRNALPAYLGIIPMIILGGLGFIVLEDIYRQARDRLRGKIARIRLSTHSKIILTTTAILLFAGAIVIFIAQSVAEQSFDAQNTLDAVFMSTTARTAGFTTVPMDELTSGSRFTLMLLMFVGGSPGSTAGGVKTMVIAVLALSIISTVRGREEVEVFGRALPDSTVKKAGTIVAGLLATISAAMLILDITEQLPFEQLLFEVISAATTTGLSLGITDQLSTTGRIVITITMFLGRVGALALVASLVGVTGNAARYKLPRDSVSLG